MFSEKQTEAPSVLWVSWALCSSLCQALARMLGTRS